MHTSDSNERPVLTPAEEDDRDQAAVLEYVLAGRPDQPTISELIRELFGPDDDFPKADAVERAVNGLTGAGLLHRERDTIRPTRAARRFDQLHNRN